MPPTGSDNSWSAAPVLSPRMRLVRVESCSIATALTPAHTSRTCSTSWKVATAPFCDDWSESAPWPVLNCVSGTGASGGGCVGRRRIQATSRAARPSSSSRGGRSPTPAFSSTRTLFSGAWIRSARGRARRTMPGRVRPAVPSATSSRARYSGCQRRFSSGTWPVVFAVISQTWGTLVRSVAGARGSLIASAGTKPRLSSWRPPFASWPRRSRTARLVPGWSSSPGLGGASAFGANRASQRLRSAVSATRSNPSGTGWLSANSGVVW